MSKKDKEIGTFGDYLRVLRENKGLTQSSLASKSGISLSYVSRLENNERVNISFKLLTILSKALDISIINLLQISLEIDEEKSKDIGNVILEGQYVIDGKEVPEEARVLLYDIIISIINYGWENEKKVDMLSEELIRKVKYLNQIL